jgi:hypothetical protein
MTELEIAKTPKELVGEINQAYDAVQTHAYNAVVHAIRCGELLTQAKAKVPHGGWEPWIHKHFDGSQQTANVYMRLHAKHGGSRDLPESISQAIRSLMPSEPREKPPEPKDPATRNLLGNLGNIDPDEQILDATVVEDPPARMVDRAQRKWRACRTSAAEIAEQILITDEQSDESWASTFREASKRARSLAVELEALAETVERNAS